MAFQVGPNFVQTPQVTQVATAAAAAAGAGAGNAQGAQAGGAGGFDGALQQIIQTLQSLAAQLGQGAGAQTQGPFLPGAPNPADAGPVGQGQGGAQANAGAATATAGIGADGKPFAFAQAGGNVAQAGAVPGADQGGAATGASSSGASSSGAGAMSGDEKCITTKGGYKIESQGGGSWSITGPDGKKTDIQGDPHVLEGDGGRWDFNKDASFVLGDGTKVNVKVDNLVSSKLEVSDGNQRAEIDAQTGKAGPVQQGPAQFDTAQNDVFTQGAKGAEDWTKGGREIKGGGMDGNQELGEAMATAPGADPNAAGQAQGGAQAQAPAGQGGLQGIVDQIQQLLGQLGLGGPAQGAQGAQGGAQQAQPAAAAAPAQAAQAPAQGGGLQDALGAITKMIDVVSQVLKLFQGAQPQQAAIAA